MRYLLLLSVLLLGASWVVAQSDASQSKTSTSSSTGSTTSVQGCLSSSDGNYTLTEKNGTTYQLNGDAAVLSKHVGHEVKITGTENTATASASGETPVGGMAQSGNSAERSIQVSSLKHISKTCQK